MDNLQFDPVTHSYTVNGRRLVSVTQALQVLDDRPKDPWYLLRGTYVHRVCEFDDDNSLDESTVDPKIMPYLEAYRQFKRDTGFEPLYVEHRLSHPRYAYAGALDRIGPLGEYHTILDLKSGAPAKVDPLQGAAYWELANANGIPVKKVFDLYLKEDGKYKLEPVINPKGLLPVFLACLTIARFKEGI